MAKSTGMNFSLTASNIPMNLAKVSTFHPTYTLSIGVGRNIDVFNNWQNIRKLENTFWTWNVNPYVNINNVIIYDTIRNVQNRMMPISIGVVAELTIFFPPRLTKSCLIAISGSVTYENGNNISSLKNFQNNNPTYYNSGIIALGDIIGKIGDLKNQNSIRGRLSLPIFPDNNAIKLFSKCKDQLSVIPYYTFYGDVNSQLKHLVGLYLYASPRQNLFASNSTVVSGFGIGVDWVVLNGLSNASVFLQAV